MTMNKSGAICFRLSNQTSHIYDEYTAQRIAKAISQDYVSVLLKLKEYYEN